jgi:hypothetical protein
MRWEWIGISGSIVIIFAFMEKDEKAIRILDAIGAGLFIIYGLLIGSFSTVLLNTVLILVHVKRFAELRKAK